MELTGIIITAIGCISGIILGIVKKSWRNRGIAFALGCLLTGSALSFFGSEGLGSASLSLSSGTSSKIAQLESEIKKIGDELKNSLVLGSTTSSGMINTGM